MRRKQKYAKTCENVFGVMMQIITSLDNLQLTENSAIAIGKFDGIHLGHRQLLSEIVAKKKEGLQAVVFTFNPSPSVLFSKVQEKELTSLEEKRDIFEKLGIDVLIEFPLTYETAATPKEVFVEDILVKKLKAKYIVAGTDLSFAKNGEGNSTYLIQKSQELGFEVKIIDKITYHNEVISSTAIRNAISHGKVEKASGMLGTFYKVIGIVTKGKQIGRTIGFPTVNILPEEQKMLPPNGVYKTKVFVKEKYFDAITNVGCKPTVTQAGQIYIESYLYGFEENIYGEKIVVCFETFMREEKKFESLLELKEQLQRDLEIGRKMSCEV